jgi:AbrB family looped-hinge helix DNA binding protein
VVLPVDARRKLGIEEGTELCVVVREHGIELYTRDEPQWVFVR